MPKLNRKTVKELKAQIKELLVKMPGISTLQIAQQLGRHYDLITRLREEIEEENAKRIEKEVVEKEIARFQALVEGMMPYLWRILAGKKKVITKDGEEIEVETSPVEKVAAIRAMVENYKILFDKKFEAGLFSKKLGEIQVNNKAELLNVILNNLDEPSRTQFIESAKKYLRAGTEKNNLSV